MAEVSLEYMTNTQKVAALMIALGPNTASELMKNITDNDLLERLTLDIATLNKISPEILNQILEEFSSLFLATNYLSTGGMGYAQTLLEKAYGEDQAQNILSRLVTMLNSNPFQFFNEADATQLAASFQNENPQLIALILAYLKPEHSAAILGELPPEIQKHVAVKIAEMNTTNPEIIAEIEKILESKFSSVMAQDFSKAGGVSALAAILNRSDRATEKNVIEMLEIKNQQLADEVRELMFVFEDIINLDDKAIQKILREIDTREIALALKGAKDDLKEKIFSNMSERARTMLQDDMEYMGPVRAKDVQKTQTKVVHLIRKLEAAGEIVIDRGAVGEELIE